MKYDFETFVERAGKDSTAADRVPFPEGPEEGIKKIPMWVADMSFPTAPFILDAIRARLETPSFGYFELPEEYYSAIINWQRIRNGMEGLSKEDITYENGVLGGVCSAVRAFTAPGDNVLVHSPTYVGFTGTMKRLGRNLIHSPLVRDADGIWRMDYEDMERKIKDFGIHLAIFCSPHNPTGRVWELWELEKAVELFKRSDVLVISDEIWSDIIMPGYKHIPFQSVSEDAKNMAMAFYASSKTFSLAGLVGSYGIIYNKYLRDRVLRASESAIYNVPSVRSMRALIGAFSEEGMVWTDEMCSVIEENLEYAEKLGYGTVLWSFAYADWDNDRQPEPTQAYEKIMSSVRPGTVLLLHPTSKTNAEILGKVIRSLKDEGYRFGTLDELFDNEKA